MEQIFVFGASGHAKVVIDIVEKERKHAIKFLVDDDPSLKNKLFCGYRVIGGKEDLLAQWNALDGIKTGIVAIGDNVLRSNVAQWLIARGSRLVNAVHPSVQLARGVSVGRGSVVMAGAVINSDSDIGENVIVNTKASIDHDCCIGCGAHIAPGVVLCGNVTIGNKTFICAGATVIPNLKIGSDVVIGAGSTVINNILDNVMVVGSPAKVIKKFPESF